MNLDLFKHIAEIAPGFLAVAVQNFYVGDLHDKKNKFIEYERYFVYSGLIWFLIETAINYNFIHEANRLTYSLIISVLLGFLWPACIKPLLFKLVNVCTKANGKSEKIDERSLFAMITNDGKPHYLLVYKNDKLIAEGWLSYSLDSERGFSVEADSEWKIKFANTLHGERTIVYLDSETYIKEYYM